MSRQARPSWGLKVSLEEVGPISLNYMISTKTEVRPAEPAPDKAQAGIQGSRLNTARPTLAVWVSHHHHADLSQSSPLKHFLKGGSMAGILLLTANSSYSTMKRILWTFVA